MQELSAIIVDDEAHARELIKLMLADHFPTVSMVLEAQNLTEACNILMQEPPDLLFLDIEMPEGNGFQLLEKLPGLKCPIIFTTAYEGYAIQAIKASAFDYLLKPINLEEFKAAVKGAIQKRQRQNEAVQMNAIIQGLQQQLEVRRVALPTLTGYEMIPVEQIVRAEADNNYSTVHFDDASKEVFSRSLAQFERLLKPYGFIRIHHRHVVGLRFVDRYQNGTGGGSVILKDGTDLPVSTRKKASLLASLSLA